MADPMIGGRAGVLQMTPALSFSGVSPSQRNCVDAPYDGAAGNRNLSLKLSERASPVRLRRCSFFSLVVSLFSFSRCFISCGGRLTSKHGGFTYSHKGDQGNCLTSSKIRWRILPNDLVLDIEKNEDTEKDQDEPHQKEPCSE